MSTKLPDTTVDEKADLTAAHSIEPDHLPLSIHTSLLVMRVVVGIVMVVHGWPKFTGLFSGTGMVTMLGPVAYPVAVGELFGGLGLIVGVLTRFSAASLIVIMIGAIAMVTGRNGFLVMPGKPPGFEYNLSLIALLTPILLAGPGKFTILRYLPLPKSILVGKARPFLE